MSIFYKVIILTVLLYESESWIFNDHSKKYEEVEDFS